MYPVDSLPGKYRTQLARHYSSYSRTARCHVASFPESGRFNGLMAMREPRNDYSCSLAMLRLAHTVQGKKMPPSRIAAKAIGLTEMGADQMDLYGGMRELGIECSAVSNASVDLLTAKLDLSKSFFILSMQDPYSTLNQLINVQSGHYMAACAHDNKNIYFADPAFADGKTRVSKGMLPFLWYDLVIQTQKILYGFMIEVPVKV